MLERKPTPAPFLRELPALAGTSGSVLLMLLLISTIAAASEHAALASAARFYLEVNLYSNADNDGRHPARYLFPHPVHKSCSIAKAHPYHHTKH